MGMYHVMTAEAGSLAAAFEDGLGALSTSVTDMITTIAPIAIGIAATIFVARKAMGWFKGMAK